MTPEFKYKKQKSGTCSLTVKGDLIIEYSNELKDQLAKCKSENCDISISLEEVTAMDVTALQLIHSLRKELKTENKSLSVSAPNSENVLNLLNKSGLMRTIDN